MASDKNIDTRKAFALLWRYLILQKWKIFWGVIATFSIGLMELLTGAFLKFLTNTVTKIQGLASGGIELKIPVKLNLDLKLIGENLEIFNSTLNGSNEIMKGIIVISIIFFVLYLFQGLFQYLREIFMNLAIERVLQKFKADIFRAVLSAPVKTMYQTNSVGQVISRVNYDVAVLTETINILIEISRFIIYMVMFIPAMFIINSTFAVYTIIFFPVSFIIIRFVASVIKKSSKDVSDNVGDYTSFLEERLNSLPFVKAGRAEESEQSKFDQLVEQSYQYRKRLIFQRFFLKPSNEVLGMLVLAVLFILFSRNLLEGSGNIGDIAFFLYLVKTSFKPVKKVAQAVGDLNMALISTGKIERIFETEKERIAYSLVLPSTGIKNIRISDLSFSYNGDRVLYKLDMLIRSGEKVLLKGDTGAGKTTLSYLLMNFITPPDASIFLNDQDINNFSPVDIRKHILYLSGETPLIPGTLRENLLYGSEASLEDAKKYSELIPGIVFKHPDRKVRLSGSEITSGEARKIALARALLSSSDTLILDEVFVNTDNQDIEVFFRLLPPDRTCLIISRSLLVEKFAGRILKLERGRISV